VRSEIADSTAPGPGGVLTGRLGGGLYVTRRAFSVGIIAEPTTGPKQPGRADRQRSQRACRKEPARGSPLGRYAGWPRLTPGLKFEIRPIVRTLARCPAARRLQMKATLPGLAVSTDATWQAEIDQPSQELGMRRMSDTPHLSDILQPHQHPCSPVRCPESSPCRHYRRLERAHAPAPDRKLAAPPGPCDRGGTPASRPVRLVQPVPNPPLSSVGSDDRGCGGTRAGPGADGRQTDRARCQVRCRERCLFISNMVTLSLPKTLLSLSSARISRRFSGFCRLWDLM
jgi:hypothetical protein